MTDLGEAPQDQSQALEVVTAVVRLLREAAANAPSPEERLSVTELRILRRIARHVRLATELAAALDVTVPTVSACVDGLVRRGLVARCDAEGDRRAVPLTITARGSAVLAAAAERQHGAVAALTERLTAAERRAMAKSLTALSRVLATDRGV